MELDDFTITHVQLSPKSETSDAIGQFIMISETVVLSLDAIRQLWLKELTIISWVELYVY